MNIKSVFFDLDGTLLDTAPDLTTALNHLLIHHGRQSLPFEKIRPILSFGSAAKLICYAFQITPEDPKFNLLHHELLITYQVTMATRTTLFAGMDKVIDFLNHKNIPWGIVTNKPSWLAKPLVAHFSQLKTCRCIIGSDMLTKRKPNPEPLLLAINLVNSAPTHAFYIGDSEHDIQAARNAKIKSAVALYGYLNNHSDPRKWGADFLISDPCELLHYWRLL